MNGKLMNGKKVWVVALSLLVVVFLGGLFTGTSMVLAKGDRDKFHADVAHALLESHEALTEIAKYHARGEMPPNKDQLHEKVAHGFKHALELWGVELKPHM